MSRQSFLASAALATFVLLAGTACGGGLSTQRAREQLRALREAPVDSPQRAADLSRRLEHAVEAEALEGLRRTEVVDLLGRGTPCSRMPECTRRGFRPDDLYYALGEPTGGYAGRRPVLIVGFDRFDRVERTWTLAVAP